MARSFPPNREKPLNPVTRSSTRLNGTWNPIVFVNRKANGDEEKIAISRCREIEKETA